MGRVGEERGERSRGRERKARKEPRTGWIIKANLILPHSVSGGGLRR